MQIYILLFRKCKST